MKFGIHFIIYITFLSSSLFAQKTLDKVVAIVGDDIILESDVQNQYNYLIGAGQRDNGKLYCQAVDGMIINKLLLNKARQDSITVTADEITAEVNRRVDEMVRRVDNKANFEEITGKSLEQFKVDIRSQIEDELLIDAQKNKVLANASITPKEVQTFFKSLPEDSLGLLPAEVELNHIVAIPPYSEESKKAAKKKLEDIRKQVIEEKKDFTEMAKRYSEEPGASKSGGDLGEFGRGMMVPEFEATVFSMRVGEISKVIETEFGYHIIKLLSRKGEIVHAQHILIRPSRDIKGDSIAIARLNRALALIRKDSMTFEKAAIEFSQERLSRDCGGCVQNPQTGELRIPLSQLDTEFFFKVDEMKKGEISDPMEYTMPDGTNAFHIIYLKNKVPPHRPNIQDDYKKIYNAALTNKQTTVFNKWLVAARKNIFLDIKIDNCEDVLKVWK